MAHGLGSWALSASREGTSAGDGSIPAVSRIGALRSRQNP